MAHREDTLVCAACHKPFIVESKAALAHVPSRDLTVTSPCCSRPISTRLPQGTIVFVARPVGSAPVLGGPKGGA